ncbi:iron-siderophore ABC transporter substrate-binding protein [Miltoncostaea marina]|uniref:iron-siderophore ABC transporter substrate-binding protein n=1 Tax=Miltoncostaea marina TaxID=2843215 RepID=UPI001C3E5E8C|nr:iron-siderophore ABC transporter substrate-binding protein [Miltoncostaea marina]
MTRVLVLLGVLVLALGAAACGEDEGEASGSTAAAAAAGAFPVTIEHAFGSTTVEAPPERVVAWGWASADAAIALGVTPVAIPFQEYGGDDAGVLPWIRDAVEGRGEEVPTVLPKSGDEPPYEAIAAAEPDLILAPYSGVTAEQYELLSDIAPTVAYPEEAWATPWRDTIRIVGRALGRDDEAAALLERIDATLAEQAEAHPELAGKSVAMVWDAAGTFYVYKPADPRVEATLALGLTSAPSVEALANGDETFYYTLSYERLDELRSDILVSFADTRKLSRDFLASSHARTMAQVRNGTVAQVIGPEFVAAVSPPTALSLTWGLEEYVDILAAAAARVDQGS